MYITGDVFCCRAGGAIATLAALDVALNTMPRVNTYLNALYWR